MQCACKWYIFPLPNIFYFPKIEESLLRNPAIRCMTNLSRNGFLFTLWIDESVGVIKVDPASGRLPGHFYSILAIVFFLAENVTNIYVQYCTFDSRHCIGMTNVLVLNMQNSIQHSHYTWIYACFYWHNIMLLQCAPNDALNVARYDI